MGGSPRGAGTGVKLAATLGALGLVAVLVSVRLGGGDADRVTDGRGRSPDRLVVTDEPVPLEAGAPELRGLRFRDVTTEAGLGQPQSAGPLVAQANMTSAAAVADLFGSGFPDIYLSRVGLPNLLYRNNGDGTFTDVTDSTGLRGPDPSVGSGPAAFFDADGNGCLDLYVTSISSVPDALYMNDCRGGFRDEAAARGLTPPVSASEYGNQTHGVEVGDYDLDGWLDVLVLHWDTEWVPGEVSRGRGSVCDDIEEMSRAGGAAERRPGNRSRLYRNDGAGHFVDVTESVGLDLHATLAFTGQFADVTGDGWPDLLVTGDACTSRLYRNEEGRRFTDITREAGVGTDENGMGSVVADFDGDGLFDWFVTSISFLDPAGNCPASSPFTGCSGNRLYRNRGNGRFEDVTDATGVRHGWWGWGAAAEDFIGDGSIQIAQTNGYRDAERPGNSPLAAFFAPFRRDPMRFWVETTSGFRDAARAVGLDDAGVGHALVPLDYDRDGALDLLVARAEDPPLLYRNERPADRPSWTIRLDDPSRPGNRGGIGARIVARSGRSGRSWLVSGGGSYEAFKPNEVYVGSPSAAAVTVEVTWPGTETPQIVADLAPGRLHVIAREGPAGT